VDLPATTTLHAGGQGVREGRGYDANSRLSSLQTVPVAVGQTWNRTLSYGYNAAGQTSAITGTPAGPTQLGHDALGRLTVAVQGGDTYRWSYDGNDNLLSERQVTLGAYLTPYTYVYPTGQVTPTTWLANELVSVNPRGQGLESFGYDQSGNTTVITPSAPTPASMQSLRYDGAGRLSGVSLVDGTRFSLSYNARGLRASLSKTAPGQSQPSITQSFLYRGNQVGQVTVVGPGSTAFTETFLYRQDGAPLELLRQVAGQAGTQRYWYVVDKLGAVLALADSSGALVNRYYYDLWGGADPLNPDTEAVPQPLRYAGYWDDSWYDGALGTHNFGPLHRYWLITLSTSVK